MRGRKGGEEALRRRKGTWKTDGERCRKERM